jgi:hypothetical protein
MNVEKTIFALFTEYWSFAIHSLHIQHFKWEDQCGVYVSVVTKAGIRVEEVFGHDGNGNIIWPFIYCIGQEKCLTKGDSEAESLHQDVSTIPH